MRHSTGLRVLLAPTRPDQASSVTVELIRDVYASLRSTFDVVIVDTPPGFTAEVIATIDAASDLVLIGMLDALSLKNTKLGLETLELMGCEPSMITHRAQPRADARSASPRATSRTCSAASRTFSSRATARFRAPSTRACRS